jgi:hypothetical protein
MGWDVEVSSQHGTWICRLAGLYDTPHDMEEIRWYLEVFSSNSWSPFETSRAASCHERLMSLARKLHVELEMINLQVPEQAHIEIHVIGESTDSAFCSYPWEILEDVSLFAPASK